MYIHIANAKNPIIHAPTHTVNIHLQEEWLTLEEADSAGGGGMAVFLLGLGDCLCDREEEELEGVV